ncbi:MAG: alpha/beta fold hydrolase [Candidatus Coatesbacteria bacterium]|nr:alpha/beta fold hydrolase [Candidatus Coatesbacteria bacterium]
MTPGHIDEGRPPDWVPTDLYPFENRYLELEGHTIHYVDEGAGPTLLLLHGNPAWSFLYREIIQGLRDRFRCVALDYPGFGLSTAAGGFDYLPESQAGVVRAFVEELDLRDYTVMIQDWGGPIGLWTAERHPERVRGLIVGNTWGWPIDGDRHFERFSKMMGGGFGRFLIRNFNAFVNLIVPLGIKRKRLPRRVMNAYRKQFPSGASRMPTNIFPREIRGSSSFLGRIADDLDRLEEKPALILWGDRDIAFRAGERERFELLFRTHRTCILEGAGHFIQEDAPGEIVAAVRAWWDEVVVA